MTDKLYNAAIKVVKDFIVEFLKSLPSTDEKGNTIMVYNAATVSLLNHFKIYGTKKNVPKDIMDKVSKPDNLGKILAILVANNQIEAKKFQQPIYDKGWGLAKHSWSFDMTKMAPTATPPTIAQTINAAATAQTMTAAPTVPLAPSPVLATPVKQPIMINITDDDESEPEPKKMKTEPSARFKNLEDCKQYITQDEYDRKKAEILATI